MLTICLKYVRFTVPLNKNLEPILNGSTLSTSPLAIVDFSSFTEISLKKICCFSPRSSL